MRFVPAAAMNLGMSPSATLRQSADRQCSNLRAKQQDRPATFGGQPDESA
jgi:hypothetical protein